MLYNVIINKDTVLIEYESGKWATTGYTISFVRDDPRFNIIGVII